MLDPAFPPKSFCDEPLHVRRTDKNQPTDGHSSKPHPINNPLTMHSPNDTPSRRKFEKILDLVNEDKLNAKKGALTELLNRVECAIDNGVDQHLTTAYPLPEAPTEPGAVTVGICADYYAQLKAAGLVDMNAYIETDGLSLRVESISNKFYLTIKKFDYDR